jgi:hypothetical protein
VRAGEHGAPFVPDDLLVMEKADAEQTIEHFARELAGVPHVSDLETRHQRESFRPVGARIAEILV